jgi:hypothetical protein
MAPLLKIRNLKYTSRNGGGVLPVPGMRLEWCLGIPKLFSIHLAKIIWFEASGLKWPLRKPLARFRAMRLDPINQPCLSGLQVIGFRGSPRPATLRFSRTWDGIKIGFPVAPTLIGISESPTLACETAIRMQEKLPQGRYLSDHLIAGIFRFFQFPTKFRGNLVHPSLAVASARASKWSTPGSPWCPFQHQSDAGCCGCTRLIGLDLIPKR